MEGGGGGIGHLFVTVFLSTFAEVVVAPGIIDVRMAALCPGEDECSLAIYLSGFQQAIVGVGTMVMLPLIGSLSDEFGRKAILTFPMTLSIIPSAILACNTTTSFFYAYCVSTTLISVVFGGSVSCLCLAYLADNVPEERRTSAFGIISGIASAASFGGIVSARFLPTTRTFQVAMVVYMIAVVYMRIFLKDTKLNADPIRQPISKTGDENNGESSKTNFRKLPSPKEVTRLLRSSSAFTYAAFVTFFSSLASSGFEISALYFFKAQFHFSKNQYADLMLIDSVSGTISQLLFMPVLATVMEENTMLSVGLFFTFLSFLLISVAWSRWVVYAVSVLTVFTVFVTPCVRSIVSKQVGPNEQGIAQGSISSIASLANMVSPFLFTPLTDSFLSSRAPFHFPGFSLMCASVASMIAFISSVVISTASPISSDTISSKDQMEEV